MPKDSWCLLLRNTCSPVPQKYHEWYSLLAGFEWHPTRYLEEDEETLQRYEISRPVTV